MYIIYSSSILSKKEEELQGIDKIIFNTIKKILDQFCVIDNKIHFYTLPISRTISNVFITFFFITVSYLIITIIVMIIQLIKSGNTDNQKIIEQIINEAQTETLVQFMNKD